MAEVAEDGKHYDISKSGKVLCRVPGCISMFRGLAGYQRHAERLHKLKRPAPERKRHAPGDLDSEDNTAAGRRKKRRRKQPGDPHCPQYDRQRGSVEARWKHIWQRKKRDFKNQAEEFIKERKSTRPKAPQPTFLTLVMEKALPKMGYEVWSFLLDKSKLKVVTEMLECEKIQVMCREVESQHEETTEEDGMALLRALQFLKIIFVAGPVGEMINLSGYRELMIKETQEWMSEKAELLKFEEGFDENQIRRDALNNFEEWEQKHKDTSLKRIKRMMDQAKREGQPRTLESREDLNDIDASVPSTSWRGSLELARREEEASPVFPADEHRGYHFFSLDYFDKTTPLGETTLPPGRIREASLQVFNHGDANIGLQRGQELNDKELEEMWNLV